MNISGEGGFVAGLEALAFGVLVFVVGTLMLVNVWVVVDGAFAAGAAAREAVRAVVEADSSPPIGDVDGRSLDAVALAAARQAVEAHGYEATALRITVRSPGGTLTGLRCAPVRIEAAIEVRGIVLPGMAGMPPRTVVSTYEEVVDPFRAGLMVREGLDRLLEEGNPCGF